MTMDTTDFYKTLGVQPDTPPDEIRNAYHRLAREHHPDVSESPDAEERMKAINEAYRVLSDPEKRREYDRTRIAPGLFAARDQKEPAPAPRPRHNDPRYDQAGAGPVPQKLRQRKVSSAAAFWILLLVIFVLALLFVGGKPAPAPSPPAAIPQPVPSPAPLVTTGVTPSVTRKTFDTWRREGDAFRQQDRNGDALAAYDRALVIRPNFSVLWIAEGDIYCGMGYFKNALACYDRALAVNASAGREIGTKIAVLKNLDSWMDHAETLVEEEDYAAAIVIYDSILSAEIPNAALEKRILSAKVYALLRWGHTAEAARVSNLVDSL